MRSSGGDIVEAFMAAVGGVEECARRGRGWMGDYEHGDMSSLTFVWPRLCATAGRKSGSEEDNCL